MRAAMAIALVEKPKFSPTPGNKAFEGRDPLEDIYSSRRAVDAIEVAPAGPK